MTCGWPLNNFRLLNPGEKIQRVTPRAKCKLNLPNAIIWNQ